MALIDKDQIRTEIERRTYNAHEMPDSRPDKQFYEGKDAAYGEILAFLDTLPEQPVEGLEGEIERFCEDMWDSLPNFNYSDGKAVITVVEKAASHFYELGQKSRPKISYNPLELEQEILSYIRGMGFGYGGWVDGLEDEDLCKLARHFAEWGAEHLKK